MEPDAFESFERLMVVTSECAGRIFAWLVAGAVLISAALAFTAWLGA